MSKITITTVAKKANVSKSTVSHVINNTRFVEEKTRQKVLKAIQKLDYRPNQLARSLATKQTFTIGLIISDVSNPFYHQVIHGIEDLALKNGYTILLFNTNYEIGRTLKYLDSIKERCIDGIILMSSRLTKEVVAKVANNKVPAVIVDYPADKIKNCGLISLNFEPGIRQMIEHLLSLGHTRFAHVSGSNDIWTANIRKEIFLKILSEKGIDNKNVTIIEGDLSIKSGQNSFNKLLSASPRPTAVFAANDLVASGIIFEANKQGYQIPDLFSIIGLDNIELGRNIQPTLTTIALPCYEIGESSAALLLKILQSIHKDKKNIDNPLKLEIQTQFIKRDSIGPPIIK